MAVKRGSFSTSVDDNLSARNWRLWVNGPSQYQPVLLWRERTMALALSFAIAAAPVNNPLNARHRAGWTGEFKRSMSAQRTGNQYGRGFLITNSAAHAVYVEEGRSASRKMQYFSWTRDGGVPRTYKSTRSRQGQKVIKTAVDRALLFTTSGS